MEKRETDILLKHTARLRSARLLLEDGRQDAAASPEAGSVKYGKSPIYLSEPGEPSEEQQRGSATVESNVYDDDKGQHIPTSRSQTPEGKKSNSTSKLYSHRRPESEESIRHIFIKPGTFLRKTIPDFLPHFVEAY